MIFPKGAAIPPGAWKRWSLRMSMHTGMCHPRNAAELLLAARSGDRSAWEELVLRYSGVVRSAVSEFRLQESDAADVVQNTWLRLLVHAATIREPGKLGG